MTRTLRIGIVVALITFIALTPSIGLAVGSGGFENAVFSAQQLGAGATGTASPNEPAAISYNPAGITDLKGIQVQGNGNFLSLLTWKSSDTTGDTRSTGKLNFIPTGYLTVNPGAYLGNRIAFGIGCDSPFGFMNQYSSTNPIVRYNGWQNYLKMFAIKPVVAFKVNDKLSFGAGPMWYRVFDFGAILAYPNILAAQYTGKTDDGQIRLNLSGQHWGWHMGALYKLTPKHRFGFYFRSPVDVKVSGLAKVENSSIGNFETDAHSKLPLPLNMTWAYAFQPNERTHYDIDFGYTHWGSFKRLYFPAGTTGSAPNDAILKAIGIEDKDWSNGFTLALGATHKFTQKLTGRAGTYYFWTPVPETSFTPGIPDSNRLTFSLGAGYDFTKYLTADICYYNMIFFRRHVSNEVSEPLGSVDGTYFSDLQGFTISLTLKWDNIFDKSSEKKEEKKEDVPAATFIQTQSGK